MEIIVHGDSKTSKLVGKKISELKLPETIIIGAVVRDGKVIYDGQIASIFREKNAAKEVKSGLECGITFRNFLDFKEKDMIESYKVDMIERQIND